MSTGMPTPTGKPQIIPFQLVDNASGHVLAQAVQELFPAAHLLVTSHQRCVNLFLAKLDRSVEGCDVGAAASENRDSVAHHPAAMQCHALALEKRDYLAAVQVARQGEHVGTSLAHLIDHLARVGLAPEVGKVARDYHQVRSAHHLVHPFEVAGSHMDVAERDYLHRDLLDAGGLGVGVVFAAGHLPVAQVIDVDFLVAKILIALRGRGEKLFLAVHHVLLQRHDKLVGADRGRGGAE